MRYVVRTCLAATCLALGGCGSPPPQPAGPHVNAAPGPGIPASAQAPRIVRRFVGIPMPANNVLDIDRTVIVGDDRTWVGRIFLTAPMTVDQTIELYRHDMPRYGWTELAVTRSDTSVLAYRMGDRIATIELTRQPDATGTRVEFWVNPVHAGDPEQAARPAESYVPPAPVPLPRTPVEGERVVPGTPRAVDQAPLPPPSSR